MLQSQKKQIDLYDDVSNPLDSVEEIMLNNDWQFHRLNDDEMSVTVSGQFSHYKMVFIWQADYSALQFCCAPDLQISPNHMDDALKVINNINASIWLGHFDIRTDTDDNTAFIPCFRHTSLFRDQHNSSGMAHMEDLIDIAIHECERNMTAFNLLAQRNHQSKSDMALALMETAGLA